MIENLPKYPKVDVCYFCSKEYHPQLVCTLKPQFLTRNLPNKIWVCEMDFIFDDNGEFQELKKNDACKNKALEMGYELRRDLTPTR